MVSQVPTISSLLPVLPIYPLRFTIYSSMANFLDTLKERIVVFDGAMGTNLQVQNLSLEDFGGLRFEGCNENLLVTRPDAVENVHVAFLEVGCDVIETNSFNGTPVDFAEYDIGDKAYDMNVLAAQFGEAHRD